jgi:hypothetical protein
MPTKRSAAARATTAARAVPLPPQRVSAQRANALRAKLDLGRGVADELGDVSRSDDDRIDSRPLELVNLFATPHRHVGHRELAGRDVREQLERAAESIILVVGRAGPEQEDLRVEPVESELKLLLASHLDNAVHP